MTDIVERLRALEAWIRKPTDPTFSLNTDLFDEAADEIERLRAALEDCMQEAANHHRENETRAKLGGSDMAQRKARAIVSRSGVLSHNIKAIARAALGKEEA